MNDDEREDPLEDAIAIVGMAGRFPGAADVERFWRNLSAGVESISFFTEEELTAAGVDPELVSAPGYVRAKPMLEDVDLFDAGFFGLTPREAEVMDPQHRVLLETSWEALENAGYDPETFGAPIGIFAGVGLNTYLLYNLAARLPAVAGTGLLELALGNDANFPVTRVAYKLNLRGPAVTVQSSCSTSLTAVVLACQSLLGYHCDMALAGAASVSVPQKQGYQYEPDAILSPDGHCRSFDARAGGTLFGDAAAVVVLRRLREALDSGDHVYSVIRGSAINNDGSLKAGFTAPSVAGQEEVITLAQAMAGVDPETIRYVECHATGTRLGDPIEIEALTQAFRRRTSRTGFCAIGSVKSNVGHLGIAAGVTGLVKTTLALHHERIPPTLHFETPNPEIDFDASPFFVATAPREWPRSAEPRRAGVSSFGMGGSNAHVVLEEAPVAERFESPRPWCLLAVSARTPTALGRQRENLDAFLDRATEVSPADASYTLQVGRRPFERRSIRLCRSGRGRPGDGGAGRWLDGVAASPAPALTFLFPGHGAQYVGMGRALYEHEEGFRTRLDHCAEVLSPLMGHDLREVLYPGAARSPAERREQEEQLRRTRFAQPALFTVEYALARLLMDWGVRPQSMIGHSIGEYVAACLAGVLSLEDALRLVALRARLMQAMPRGAMSAVALPEHEVAEWLDESLSVAAVNDAESSVVSGPVSSVERLEAALRDARIASRRLRTSHAFHSRMMDPIVEDFLAAVREVPLSPPAIPYLSNVSGGWIKQEEATDPAYWARHVSSTVRFGAGLAHLRDGAGRVLLEVGPGSTLRRYAAARKERPASHLVLAALERGRGASRVDDAGEQASLLEALGRCWLAGVPVRWSAYWSGERRRRVPLPAYPFDRERYWVAPARPGAVAPEALVRQARSRWFYAPSWKRLPASGAGDAPSGWGEGSICLVLADAFGLGRAVAEQLQGVHPAVVTLTAGDVDAEDPGHLARVLEGLVTPAVRSLQVLHCWSLSRGGRPLEDFERAQDLGLFCLVGLGKSIAALRAQGLLPEGARVTSVTNGVHDVTGTEELHPESATLLAAVRAVAQEIPGVACRNVDLEQVPEDFRRAAARVTGEMLDTGGEPVVAHRGGYRWGPAYEPIRLPEEPTRLRRRGVYLVVGGLGRMGRTVAEYLARTVEARLVLVQRHEPPPDGEAVRRLESLGAEVLVLRADVTRAEEMRAALERGRARFGPIHGVVFAAGVRAEDGVGSIQEVSREELLRQLRPKVYGAAVLEEVLGDSPPDFLLVPSSPVTFLGGAGLVAYGAAHQFLDAYVSRHNRAGGTGRWDRVTWAGLRTGSGDRLSASHHGQRVVLSVSPADSMAILASALSSEAPAELVVSTADLDASIARATQPATAPRPEPGSAPRPRHDRPELSTELVEPRTELERTLAAAWQEVLGVERIGVHDDFFELGGQSLAAVQVMTRISHDLRVKVPLARFFEAPTIAALAAFAERQLGEGAPDDELEPGVEEGDVESSLALLDEIEKLGEEEVRAALGQEKRPVTDLPAPDGRRRLGFSIFFFSESGTGENSDRYQWILECARAADRLGFEAVWTPERHFHPFGGLYPNPSTLSAALAVATRRIDLRAGSVVLPLHHPVRVAEEWSLVDNLSGGRVGVSVASGWQPEDFLLARQPYARRYDEMRRGIEQLTALWRGEPGTFTDAEGRSFSVKLFPRPVQPSLPLWVSAATNPRTWEMAGELGAHVLSGLFLQTPEELAERIAIYREALERAGHGAYSRRVSLMLHAFVWSDEETVLRKVKEPLTEYLRSHMRLSEVALDLADEDFDPEMLTDEDKATLLEAGFEKYFRHRGLFGTPESCAERVSRLHAAGVDEIACLLDYGVDAESVLASLDFLARLKDAVAPHP